MGDFYSGRSRCKLCFVILARLRYIPKPVIPMIILYEEKRIRAKLFANLCIYIKSVNNLSEYHISYILGSKSLSSRTSFVIPILVEKYKIDATLLDVPAPLSFIDKMIDKGYHTNPQFLEHYKKFNISTLPRYVTEIVDESVVYSILSTYRYSYVFNLENIREFLAITGLYKSHQPKHIQENIVGKILRAPFMKDTL
jgi:hypothetical protein